MIAQRISARNLLQETFAAMGSVYVPMLILNCPSLIFVLVKTFVNLSSATVALNIIYWFCVVPFLSGAIIFYTYRSLTGNQVTISESFKQANKILLQLILVHIMYTLMLLTGLIVLIVPGFYITYRLIFVFYATVIDKTSALDSISRSWELTKGRWWLVFRSTILISFVAILPIVLIALSIDITGKSPAAQLVSSVLGFLVGPLMGVYFVLLYLRLRESPATIK